MQLSLNVRCHGFNIKGKPKYELITILSKCLRYERRYFKIQTIIRIQQIEKEINKLLINKRTVKNKRSKLMSLWVESFMHWSPLKLHIIEERKRLQNKHAEMLLSQYDRAESEYMVTLSFLLLILLFSMKFRRGSNPSNIFFILPNILN